MPARFWTCATITTIGALVSAGFSVAGLIGPSGSDIFERYATSRSIALLIEGVKKARLRTRSIREASREDHFGEVDGHFVLRGHCRVHRVMGRFPQAIALLLAYPSAAIATSPYSLPAAQLLGCPPYKQ